MSLAGIAFGTASHVAALLGHGKAKRWWPGRLNLPPKGPFDLLVHCASWGEFWMVEPLLQRWSAEGRRVLVSFFSPSGMEGWSRYQAPDGIFACLAPLDFNPYLGRFLKECEPKALLILQTDLWPGLAAQAIRQKVPFGLAFAHVPRGHRWWTPLGLLDRTLLRKAAFVGLQEASGMKLALAAGLPALLLGDGRFDSAASRIARGDGPLPHWHAFADHQPLLVCGSTWAQDEDLLLPLLMRRSHWRFVFAPHDPERAEEVLRRLPLQALRSSQWQNYSIEHIQNHRILVVDQIGLLFGLYGGAQAAYVGGAFGQGLHSIIEPLSWGLPVAFGPSTGRHWEADEAIEKGLAQKVSNFEEALDWLDRAEGMSLDSTWAQSQQGALARLGDLVEKELFKA